MRDRTVTMRVTTALHAKYEALTKLLGGVSLTDVMTRQLEATPVSMGAAMVAANLNTNPHAAFSKLLSKGPADTLSQGEWLFIAEWLHSLSDLGSERTSRYPYSDWACLFAAVEAVMTMIPDGSPHYPYYYSKLVGEVERDGTAASLVQLAKLTTAGYTEKQGAPEFPARVLHVALRDEAFNERTLDTALRPYREELLRLALRGYVAGDGQPIVPESVTIPTLQEREADGILLIGRIANDLIAEIRVGLPDARAALIIRGLGTILDVEHALRIIHKDPTISTYTRRVSCFVVTVKDDVFFVLLSLTGINVQLTLSMDRVATLRDLLAGLVADPTLGALMPALRRGYGE